MTYIPYGPEGPVQRKDFGGGGGCRLPRCGDLQIGRFQGNRGKLEAKPVGATAFPSSVTLNRRALGLHLSELTLPLT